MIEFVEPRKDIVWHNKNLTEPLKWRALEIAWARKLGRVADKGAKRAPFAMTYITRNILGITKDLMYVGDGDDVMYTMLAFAATLLEEGDINITGRDDVSVAEAVQQALHRIKERV